MTAGTNRSPLAGQTVGVLGLARSGVAAARLALARGARVYASDAAESPATHDAAEQLRYQGADADAGRHDLERLTRLDRVVLSPGIPPTAPVIRELRAAGVETIGELEFAWEALRGRSRFVAITGTNGKTTTTALAAHLLAQGGVSTVAAGNIGLALSEVALRPDPPAWVITEVSSFQLADTERFRPEIGMLTNLAPDHLDRYPGVDEYYADKARLFRNATADSCWVLNGEDPQVLGLAGEAPGERLLFRITSLPDAGERGAFLDPRGWLVLRPDGAANERLIPAAELPILGAHNIANALAAALVAHLVGISRERLADGLRSFRPVPHRLEPVAERDGVLWINDSKATNLASTAVALRGVSRPTVLLLGGRHKGEPYTGLLPDLDRVRVVLAFGEAAPLIESDLDGRVAVERLQPSLETVVRRAAEIARPGDAVLLSPACSSFDMFKNYEQRGDRFRSLVTELQPS